MINTFAGLIIPLVSGSYGIFLCKQFYENFPKSLDEAAEIDGLGKWRTFFQIYLPNSKAILATLALMKGVAVWNDYLWPSLVFTSSDLLTAQIGLNAITSNDNTTTGQTLAVITMVTIPVIIIYSLFSKQIVEGVISTGSKEG